MRYRYMNEYGARGKHAFMHRFIKTPFDKPFGDDDGPVGGGGGNWWEQPQWDDFAAVPDLENWRFALPAWGAEQVINGSFGTDLTGWLDASTAPSTVVWSSGQALWQTDGAATARLRQSIPTVAGNLYRLTATGTVVSTNALFVGTALGLADIGLGTVVAAAIATGGFYFVAKSATTWINTGSNVNGLTLDNVSLREVILTRGGAALGANLAASGYTMSVNGGTGTATESPAGQLNLTGDGVNAAIGDKSFTTVIGRNYRVMSSVTAGFGLSVGTSQGGTQNISATPGAGFNALEFTATATTTWIRFSKTAASLATISAIEIRELPATGAFPKRAATFSEYYSFTATSTTQRSYVDSTGTRRNDLAANEPRRDWRTGKQSWRLEDARTNESLYSNTLDTGAWARTQGGTGSVPVVTADFGIAPDGTQTAARVQLALNGGNTSADQSSIRQNKLLTNAVTYTHSVWMKSNTGATYVLQIVDSEGSVKSNITVTPAWQRFSITRLQTSTTGSWGFWLRGGTGSSDSADVLTWDDQLELGAFASDPIITTTVAVTRAIETARFSPLVEAILQRAAGSVVVRGKHDYAAAAFFGQMLGLAGGASMLASEGSATVLAAYNGTSTVLTTLGSGTVTAAFGAAASFDSGGRSISGNGSSPNSDTSTIGDRSKAYLARREAAGYGPGNYKLGGAISPERLSNAKLQALAVA